MKEIKVGDKIKVHGKELEVVDFLTDGVHHEFCLGDRKTKKASWGYYLKHHKPKVLSLKA